MSNETINIKEWRISLWWLVLHVNVPPPLRKCYTLGHYHAREPHVSCTWGAPLHHRGNATCEGIIVHVSHTWMSPPHVSKSHTWMSLHTWVSPTRECPSTIEENTWGHYRAREPPVSCMWGAPLHHWGNATREGITVHVSHMWMSPPHVSKSHMWMSPPHVSKSHTWMSLHHWGNATREGITVHVSHTWAVREGLPSTIEEMLHVRALPCTWAHVNVPSTCE